MAPRKAFLLRIDPAVLAAMQRWANDDLRSLNAQVEFVLRRTLEREGRLPVRGPGTVAGEGAASDPGADATGGGGAGDGE